MILVTLVSQFVPGGSGPRRMEAIRRVGSTNGIIRSPTLLGVKAFTTLTVTVRGFPRKVTAFASTLRSPSLKVTVTTTVTVRGVPRKVTISIPICCTAKDGGGTFGLSFLSKLSRPVNTFITCLVLVPCLGSMVFKIVFTTITKVVIFVSLSRLLPTTGGCSRTRASVCKLITKVTIVTLDLLLFLWREGRSPVIRRTTFFVSRLVDYTFIGITTTSVNGVFCDRWYVQVSVFRGQARHEWFGPYCSNVGSFFQLPNGGALTLGVNRPPPWLLRGLYESFFERVKGSHGQLRLFRAFRGSVGRFVYGVVNSGKMRNDFPTRGRRNHGGGCGCISGRSRLTSER